MNEVLETIYQRRSVRQFSDQPVRDEDISLVLNAANHAPSAHNSQSWKFVILKGVKRRELAELIIANSKEYANPTSALLRMAARSIASAPVTIAVANTGDLISHGTELFKVDKVIAHDFFRTIEIQKYAAAVENLLIAATALGLSTVWLGVLFIIKEEILRFLAEPNGEFMAVIPIGYSKRSSHGPKKKPLDIVIKEL